MIELQSVERTFAVDGGITHVLKGVDLVVDEGDFVAIMGPSGAGKTTLLNIIGLLDTASSGAYRLAGRNVTALGDRDRAQLRNTEIGFVFQLFNLLDRLSTLENVTLPLLYATEWPNDAVARAVELLQQVGLTHRLRARPNTLSGGEQQRVAIARALINRPRLLVADEPTGNLDSAMGREVLRILQGLNRGGLTIVMVTHDPDVAGCAGRAVTIVDGRVERDARQTPRVVE